MWEDYTLKTYILLTAVALYDFILFLGWGIYVGVVERRMMSAVFWAITGMFMAVTYAVGLNAHIRHVRFVDMEHYISMMKSNFWAFRHIPLVLILIGIGCFMTRRVWRSYFFKKSSARRRRGRRQSDITN